MVLGIKEVSGCGISSIFVDVRIIMQRLFFEMLQGSLFMRILWEFNRPECDIKITAQIFLDSLNEINQYISNIVDNVTAM